MNLVHEESLGVRLVECLKRLVRVEQDGREGDAQEEEDTASLHVWSEAVDKWEQDGQAEESKT